MKILYIASERSRAQVATRALRAIAPNVTVLWGSNFERAAFSILENPDLAALIVEVQSDSHGCSYLRQMGTLGVQAPVVMVLPEGAGSPIQSLKAGAAYYVEKGASFRARSISSNSVFIFTLGWAERCTIPSLRESVPVG